MIVCYSKSKISSKCIKNGKTITVIEFRIEIQKSQFQQAIDLFSNELEHLLSLEKINKFLASDLKHSFFKKNWTESKKDISNPDNFFLFEIWLSHRVVSYNASSSEPINLLPLNL